MENVVDTNRKQERDVAIKPVTSRMKRACNVGLLIEKFYDNLCGQENSNALVYHRISRDWAKIVGKKIADYSLPANISFFKYKTVNGSLLVLCKHPSIAMMLKAEEKMVLDKLSCYLGYKAIDNLRLKVVPSLDCTQRTKAASTVQIARQPVTSEQLCKMHSVISVVQDDAVRTLLQAIVRRSYVVDNQV